MADTSLSRRTFIGATAVTAAVAAVPRFAAADGLDADVVVVGAGMSGLACAVAASGAGARVIVVEAGSRTGGNGLGTEGMFAANSSLQRAMGLEYTVKEIILKELEFFNYRIDALAWKDLVTASAGNIDWLMEQGVQFGTVDSYHGQGQLEAFHWFAGSTLEGYIDPMEAKALENGVEFLFDTRARNVLMEDGRVSGIVCETSDGAEMTVGAKVVVLCTGGYADSDEKMAEMGVDVAAITRKGFPHHNGDGLDMALAVGGVDTRTKHCIMREPGVKGYPFESPLGAMGVRTGGCFVFVNGKGERYADESCINKNQAYAANCVLSQKKSFALIDRAGLEFFDANLLPMPGIAACAEEALEMGAAAWRCDTLAGLAEMIGVDPAVLTATVDAYNDMCAAGEDVDFGKDPALMLPLTEPPFWAFEQSMNVFSTIGGIGTDRDFRVVDERDEPIPGLFSAGTDGCQLYLETYTVMLPGSCNANNVNSGRRAGENAAAYCLA